MHPRDQLRGDYGHRLLGHPRPADNRLFDPVDAAQQVVSGLDGADRLPIGRDLVQAGEGWKLVRSGYDDGGVSGGTLDRPGLRQLLTDIRARRIDTVVVYKVDRLTRSLADFAKIVEVFDRHEVSFVSVTQAFNTTTSMGRLTLNMLLSFAQFEREVTGERIRDKIAASKQKGMWMGGFVPLGYEPDGRTLSINPTEAETVRTVYRLYLEHGNVRRVKEEADQLGLTTKLRSCTDGRMRGGRPLSRGYIYKLLGNPLYVGRISHKGKTYEGQHPAIIDAETWDTVQAKLAGNTPSRTTASRATDPSPLIGKLFDETGALLSPSHAVKSSRRYRYYISKRLIDGTVSENTERGGWRLPAHEIERVVGVAVSGLLANPASLTDAVREREIAADRIPDLLRATARWSDDPLNLVERVDLTRDEIAIVINLGAISAEMEISVRHVVPTQIRRRGVEMRLVLDTPGTQAAKPDPALIKAVARAHGWFDDLATGRARSIGDIAEKEGVSDRYVSHLMPLAFLAPEIVEAIINCTQPVDLSAESLIKRTDLPLDWAKQKALLGFD
jgi:DNA invertase Pin-like site-specific DNA recombinase